MKALKSLGIALLALAIVLIAVPVFLPSHVHVERSVEVHASPEKAFALLASLEEFKKWNPWAQMDPTTQVQVTGTGIGSTYEWEAEEMGKGRMTLVSIDPGKRVDYDMDFLEPMPGKAIAYFTVEPATPGSWVTWGFDQELSYFMRYMGFFMDRMMGPAFEQGLANFKELVEDEAAPIDTE